MLTFLTLFACKTILSVKTIELIKKTFCQVNLLKKLI